MQSGLFGVAACAIIASVADAQLVLTADERAISVEAAGANQAAFPSAVFAALSRDLNLEVPSGGGNGKAHATQNSTVSAAALSATGMSSANSQAGAANCVLAQATSDFRIGFHVSTPVQYSIDGSVDGSQFRLVESIGGVVHLVEAATGTTTPFSFTGVLKPGRNYLLLAQTSQLANACNGASFSLEGAYSLSGSFTALAPCPGDLNFDRMVDDSDFQIFLVAYNQLLCAGSPMPCDADLDSDGVVVDADFQIFLGAYNALICP